MSDSLITCLLMLYGSADSWRADPSNNLGGRDMSVHQAVGGLLGIHPGSSGFMRALDCLRRFGHDVQRSIETGDLDHDTTHAARQLIQPLIQPFTYPFNDIGLQSLQTSSLSPLHRSHLKLLDEKLSKKFPIYLPDPRTVENLISNMESALSDFMKTSASDAIKDDITETIQVYTAFARHAPFVAHRVVLESHKSLIAYALFNFAPDVREQIVRICRISAAALAVFIAPHEAHEAAAAYQQWYIEALSGDLALPGAVKQNFIEYGNPNCIEDGAGR
jgi:hypothetical protein